MQKKYIFTLLVLFVLTLNQTAFAKQLGAGIVLGDPSALSGKYWTDNAKAIDMGLGWDSNSNFYVFSDYLFHFANAFSKANIDAKLVPYVGVGGLIKIYSDANKKRIDNQDNSMRLVFRIPLGIEWLVVKFPVGVFIELVPGLRVYPNTTSDFGAGIGVRLYF